MNEIELCKEKLFEDIKHIILENSKNNEKYNDFIIRLLIVK